VADSGKATQRCVPIREDATNSRAQYWAIRFHVVIMLRLDIFNTMSHHARVRCDQMRVPRGPTLCRTAKGAKLLTSQTIADQSS
jgi:hypothetical protein